MKIEDEPGGRAEFMMMMMMMMMMAVIGIEGRRDGLKERGYGFLCDKRV